MLDFGPETLPLIGRVLAAALLGGVIGMERDIHGRAAGLRTHLLVGMGAGLFTVLSQLIAAAGPATADPGRIAAQIVTGIGFLGAGTIIKEGFTIRGLTTAASLWMVAAIGMAAGAGHLVLAAVSAMVALGGLVVLHYAERGYAKDSYRMLTVTVAGGVPASTVIDLVKSARVKIIFFDMARDYAADETTFSLSLRKLPYEP